MAAIETLSIRKNLTIIKKDKYRGQSYNMNQYVVAN